MRYLRSSENFRLLAIALIVGLATGISVWIFRLLIELFHHLLVVELGGHVVAHWLENLGLDPRLQFVIILSLAGVAVGWVVKRFIGHEKYHGVASIMVAGWLTGGKLPYQKMPFKAFASALSLGAGASVGPEDPSVQIGANIGSFFAQKLALSEENIRLLVAAGSASAIAAAFNAPIAGVFFAIEVILIGDLSLQSSGIVMLAAVISSAFIQAVNGANPVFGRLTYTLGSPLQLPFHALLGVLLAFCSWVIVHFLFWLSHTVHDRVKIPLPLLTGLTGALVGTIGIFVPQVMGPGEEFMHEIITGDLVLAIPVLLFIGVVKLFATGMSQSGGFVGGVFAPTLFMGIMFGSAFGQMLNRIPLLSPQVVGDPQSYAIAGMAGLLAGVVQAPITAILLVFELTNDYRLILPIMITSITCAFGMSYLKAAGIYAMSLIKDGINLSVERDLDVMQGIAVREAMASPAYTVPQTATLVELRNVFRNYKVRSLCVVDESGKLVGVVTLGDLQRMFESDYEHPELVAQRPVSDIMSTEVITSYPDDKLWKAIQTMGQANVGHLPVVDRLTGELRGVISRRAIIHTYNQAIKRKVEEQHHAEQIRLTNLTGAQVMEFRLKPDSPLCAKRIRDISFPAASVVASIQRDAQLIVPRGYTDLRPGDVLTIVVDPQSVVEIETLFEVNGHFARMNKGKKDYAKGH